MSRRIRTSGWGWRLGGIAKILRDSFVLRTLIFVGAAAAASVPPVSAWSARCSADSSACLVAPGLLEAWPWVVLALAVVAALAVMLDAVAGRHDANLEAIAAEGEVRSFGRTMAAMLPLLGEAIDIGFVGGAVRTDRLHQLQTALAAAVAAMPIAGDARATYYPLSRDNRGLRVLDNPVSRGRVDVATTVWREAEEPAHAIWQLLDGGDLGAEIARAPDTQFGVDWQAKPYKCFISVPVKAGPVLFGMLSLNAPHSDDLTESDRLSVIVAARMMATVLSLEAGPAKMRRRSQTAGVL
jgi:hypothetical protein